MEDQMINLGAGGYPVLKFNDMPLPFTDNDIGKVFRMEAVVTLDEVSPQGFGYSFCLKKISFPEIDKLMDELGQRSVDREDKINAGIGAKKSVTVNIKA